MLTYILIACGLTVYPYADLVPMLPVAVLSADLVSVWKHSMWTLCMGGAVFSKSENRYITGSMDG